MNARLLKYGPAFLLSVVLAAGCADGTTSPTAPGGIQAALFTSEPEAVGADFFHAPACRQFSPFGVRFSVIGRTSQDVFVRMLRFTLVDRFGGRSAPGSAQLQPTPSALPHSTGPITIPTSPTIPIGGTPATSASGMLGFDPLLIGARTSLTLPVFLQFGCGIRSEGVIVVDVDLADRHGRPATSQVRVQLRG